MKAFVIEAPHKGSVQEVPYPKPKAGQVTVAVHTIGICGTDVAIYKGEFISPYPIIPGHEFAGVIHEVGTGVENLEIGDRVTVDPSLFCGKCKYCLTHRGNQCENWGALGNTVDGSMAEYVAVPAENAVIMPDDMSFEIGAFIEPMACVVHGINRLQLQAGNTVLLFGAGAMGQQLIQSLKYVGASEIVIVDISKEKLQIGLDMGATKAVLSKDIEKELAAYKQGFDIVVDATGIPAVIEQALNYMGPTAKYLQFGVTAVDSQVKISPFKLYNKDWSLLGSMAVNHTFIPAFEWVKAGRIELEPLISKTIPLEELGDFLAQPGDATLLKVQVSVR